VITRSDLPAHDGQIAVITIAGIRSTMAGAVGEQLTELASVRDDAPTSQAFTLSACASALR